MAEERIWIDYPLPKNEGAIEARRCTTMTRQEAIERMVLAMHNEEIKRSIKDIPCDYRNLAEAALNALLEVGHGN
jgi:hypothetical protein